MRKIKPRYWAYAFLIFIVGLIFISLSGCSTEKQCQKHLRKAEALGCFKNSIDTIIRLDTIKGFTIDTFVQFHQEIDTLIVDSGGVKVVTIIKWKTKEIGQILSKKDTVIQNLEIVKVNTLTKFKNIIPWWYWAILGIVSLTLIISVIKRK